MKRNFKLLVAVAVIAVMVLSFASCDVINGLINGDSDTHEHNFVNGKCECGEPVPECAEADHQYSMETTKNATCTEEGENKFTCSKCGHSYTSPISALGHDEKKIEGKDPTCTEPGLTDGKECADCGEITKKQNEINPNGHSFAGGICTVCEAEDPSVPRTYVFDVQSLCAFGTSESNLGVKLEDHPLFIENGCSYPSFFTFYMSNKTKIESGKKATFPDGTTYTDALRLNHGGGTSINTTPEGSETSIHKNALMFTIPEGYNTYIKVWWTCGGDGREIGIFNADGELVAASVTDDVFTEGTDGIGAGKNNHYVSEIALSGSGVFYLGTDNTNDIKDGGNILWKVEVTVSPVKHTSDFEGSGTYDSPYVLPGTGDYTTAFPGGYEPTWHKFTATENGFLTLSSVMGENAWLKLGADPNTAKTNEGSGAPITIYVVKGNTYYVGAGDWMETAMDVPFALSFEAFVSEPVDPVVGSWKGTYSSMWAGETPYIITINEDGTGTIVEKGAWGDITYNISVILVKGNEVTIYSVDEYGNALDLTLVHDAEAQTLTGGNDFMSITFAPYVPGEDDDDASSESTLNVADSEGNRGNNEVAGSNVDFVYMADTTHTLVLEFGNAINAEVTFSYTINGGDPVAVELGSTIEVELFMGDKLVISAVTDGGWSTVRASLPGADNPGDDNTGDDNPGDDNTGDDNTGDDSEDPLGSYFNPVIIDSMPYNGTFTIDAYGIYNYKFTASATGYVTIVVSGENLDTIVICDKNTSTLKLAVMAGNDYTISFYNDFAGEYSFTATFEESALSADDYKEMLNASSAYTADEAWSVAFNYSEDMGGYHVNIMDGSWTSDHCYTYDITLNADGSFTITNLALIEGAYAAGEDTMTGKTLTVAPTADGGYLLTIE